MTETEIDLSTWSRADQFRHFRTYQKPHYAVTARVDVSSLMASRAAREISTYRACLFAIGAGVHAVPELMTRFRGDKVIQHSTIELSMTVPRENGAYGYAYVPFDAGFEAFDAVCAERIEAAAQGEDLAANAGDRDDLVYLSCLPWFDFTSISNALPSPTDCIPRVSWGKFTDHGTHWDMALSIEVHHALVDGINLGHFFDHVQRSLNEI